MAITSIRRGWGVGPSIVRLTTTDNLATVTTVGYLATQSAALTAENNGEFKFVAGDIIAIDYSDGQGFFVYDAATDQFSVQPMPPRPYKYFVGINGILLETGGTWNRVRDAAGNYGFRVDAATADPTVVLGIDLTEFLNYQPGQGYILRSFDYLYTITGVDLNTHHAQLYRTIYTDNQPLSVIVKNIVGGIDVPNNTARTNLYSQNIALTSPELAGDDDRTYVLEVAVNNQSGGVYTFCGLIVNYDLIN